MNPSLAAFDLKDIARFLCHLLLKWVCIHLRILGVNPESIKLYFVMCIVFLIYVSVITYMFSLIKPSKICGHISFWWLAQRMNLVEYSMPIILLPSTSDMHK